MKQNLEKTSIAKEIFHTLEKKHVDLYHSISKKDFEAELNKFLQVVEHLDDIHFLAGLMRLFALFKDAHTEIVPMFNNVKYINNKLNVDIQYLKNHYYILDRERKYCEEITHINGYPIEKVIDRLKGLICYEVEEYLHYCLRYILINYSYLDMIDMGSALPHQIEYTMADGTTIVAKDRFKFQQEDYYNYSYISDDILYIDYNVCYNKDDYSLADMIDDIERDRDTLPKACIIDVRDNTGGSDSVIYPLIEWLGDNNIKSYVLMNEGTFSSGSTAITLLKHYLNATSIGMPAGQSNIHYGESKEVDTAGIEYTYATKYFNWTNIKTKNKARETPLPFKLYDYIGAIRPDIMVDREPNDLRNGIDTQLEFALNYAKNEIMNKQSSLLQ